MAKTDVYRLKELIPNEEFDYTLLKGALSSYSGVRQKIHGLLHAGVITRVKKGLYVFAPRFNKQPICKEVLANAIYGPSCISLEYALAFHKLIPERVETITSVTPKRDKEFKTPLGNFTYRYLGIEKYSVGIEQVWIDKSHPILMASPEKALCDYVVLNKLPQFRGEEGAMDFLTKDLRIDHERWQKIDTRSLRKMNEVYRNGNILKVIRALESKGGSV